MPEARCLNDNCTRNDEWTLQKHPENYAGGGPACPDCGSTRVEIVGGDGAEQQIQRQSDQQRGQTVAAGGGNMVTDVFALADEEAPTERRAQAAQNVLGTVGGVVRQFMEYREQKQQARETRAQSVELERADLPTCSDCEYQFAGEDIPLGTDQIRCPECNAVYNLRNAGGQ